MINMTYKDEDAKIFITNINVVDNKYVITYADGHQEESGCVSEHNDQFYLNRLEQQFYQYRDSYTNYIGEQCLKVYTSRFIGSILPLLGIAFTYSVDINLVMKIIINVLLVSFYFGWRFIQNSILIALENELDKIQVMKYLSEHKNDYYDKIEDEETGEIKEAYIINFNNVEHFNSVEKMNNMFNALKYVPDDNKKKV